MSAGADFPIAYVLQVEGDSEVQSKLSQVDRSVEKTGNVADATAGKTENLSNSLERTGNTAEKTGAKTESMGSRFKEGALGMASLASSATNLYFQYDNLEKAQTRIDRAEKTLTVSKASLISAEQELAKLQKDGIKTGPQYEKAQLNLKAATDGVAISTDRLNQAQGDLTQSQTSFVLGVLPTVFSGLSTINTITTALRGSKLLEAGASAAQSVASVGAAGAMTVQTTATVGATTATGALSTAQRLLQIAMGPIGWAILGISAAMAAFATNAFGVRDAINAAGKAIGDAVPILAPLLEGLSNLAKMIFPEAKAETAAFESQFAASMTASGANAGAFNTSIQTSTGDVITAFDDLNVKVNSDLSTVESRANSVASTVESAAARIKASISSLGGASVLPGETPSREQTNLVTEKNLLDPATKSSYEEFMSGYAKRKETLFEKRNRAIADKATVQIGTDEYNKFNGRLLSAEDDLGALAERWNTVARALELDRNARQGLAIDRVQNDPPPVGIRIMVTADGNLKAIVNGNEQPILFTDNIT